MLRQAVLLWEQEKSRQGTTLHRRLILFFIFVAVSIILAFSTLLMIFGINGSGQKAVYNYTSNELNHIAAAINTDFGRLSVTGISLAETLAKSADEFFTRHNISARELAKHPQLLEPLLTQQIETILAAVNNNTCGGAFIMLDATINPAAKTAKAGIFVKKTQPVSVQSVGYKNHYLRGPAQLARDHGVELLGQWRMEYDISGQEFFPAVMETARANPDLPLSRLYYWSGRVTLKDNSEAGFLLCLPLRSQDGTVFGLCGIEVSARMFKQLYSPAESTYQNLFTVAAPADDSTLYTEHGLIAGNYYLTGKHMNYNLLPVGVKDGFICFSGTETVYGGLTAPLKMYPSGSPYENQSWTIALLMPDYLLNAALKGNSSSLFIIVAALLIISLFASFFISHRYLRPVTEALDSIRSQSYSASATSSYLEIEDLFGFLAQKDLEHEEELQKLKEQQQDTQNEVARAQEEIARLKDKKKREVDQDSYALFRSSLQTLTPKEREIFNLYLAGHAAKEILDLLAINQNTLKYHNRNIYSKLGVSSRKELLLYATLMKQEGEKDNIT